VPRNETDAFDELFRELYRPLLGFFARRGCSGEECQDLAQDTFLRAFRAFDRFRFDAKPSTWLLTIAFNVWRNRMRETAAAKRSGDEVPLSEASSSEASPEAEDRPPDQALDDEERRRLLRKASADLPPQMRRCVSGRAGDGAAGRRRRGVPRRRVDADGEGRRRAARRFGQRGSQEDLSRGEDRLPCSDGRAR
jgi:RNA polymerase sigma-70 factor (ECF subfamily)